MSKRFTATEKWDDPWYRKLPCKYRDFWQYILDRCDNSGVWVKDFETAVYFIGDPLDEQEALDILNTGKERISVLNGGTRWLIKDFVSFQFGVLSENSRVHRSIMALQKKHQNKGYLKGINTLKDKDKDKDKDKERGVGETKREFTGPASQKYFYDKFQEKMGKAYAADFGKDGKIFKELGKVFNEQDLKAIIDKFFTNPDEFIEKAGYTVGVFKSQVNKINSSGKTGKWWKA